MPCPLHGRGLSNSICEQSGTHWRLAAGVGKQTLGWERESGAGLVTVSSVKQACIDEEGKRAVCAEQQMNNTGVTADPATVFTHYRCTRTTPGSSPPATYRLVPMACPSLQVWESLGALGPHSQLPHSIKPHCPALQPP